MAIRANLKRGLFEGLIVATLCTLFFVSVWHFALLPDPKGADSSLRATAAGPSTAEQVAFAVTIFVVTWIVGFALGAFRAGGIRRKHQTRA